MDGRKVLKSMPLKDERDLKPFEPHASSSDSGSRAIEDASIGEDFRLILEPIKCYIREQFFKAVHGSVRKSFRNDPLTGTGLISY